MPNIVRPDQTCEGTKSGATPAKARTLLESNCSIGWYNGCPVGYTWPNCSIRSNWTWIIHGPMQRFTSFNASHSICRWFFSLETSITSESFPALATIGMSAFNKDTLIWCYHDYLNWTWHNIAGTHCHLHLHAYCKPCLRQLCKCSQLLLQGPVRVVIHVLCLNFKPWYSMSLFRKVPVSLSELQQDINHLRPLRSSHVPVSRLCRLSEFTPYRALSVSCPDIIQNIHCWELLCSSQLCLSSFNIIISMGNY